MEKDINHLKNKDMSSINYTLFWKSFVSDFIDVQGGKIKVEEEVKDYHPIIQQSFGKLGWTYNTDLFHHPSVGRKRERPDFIITYNDNRKIPIEVKLPNNVMNEDDRIQIIEYMQLSDSNIGIYIGEHVRVFFRPSNEEELKIVIDAAFDSDDIEGVIFTELFLNANFKIELLKSELSKYYEIEIMIDNKTWPARAERVKELVSEEWIPERLSKRASLNFDNKKNKRLKASPLNKDRTVDCDNNEDIIINANILSQQKKKNNIPLDAVCNIRLPNPPISKQEYDLIKDYCNFFPNMTLQDWAELAFIEKLYHDGQISDDTFNNFCSEICSRPPRGKRKGYKNGNI